MENSHGSVGSDFRKLVDKVAPHISDEALLQLSQLMGPADEGNPSIPAGYTYFGQFVDHDITFTAQDGVNARTPIFDLDSLYGDGPNSVKHGHIYEAVQNENFIFKIGNPGNADGDLLRNENFVAQIPDPRNDENIIVASIQLLFQKFHNKLVQEEGLSFDNAKIAVTWHYQSIVLNDFLVRIIGQNRVDRIVQNGRKIYRPQSEDDVFMPTEFAGACYRFGHSMVRERYSFNDFFNDTRTHPNLFFGFPGGRPVQGGHQITEIWTLQGADKTLERFFDPSILNQDIDADNFSGKMDTKLPPVLFNLEVPTGENNILAHRNLLSGRTLSLPSAQQFVEELNELGVHIDLLSPDEISVEGIPPEIVDNTPLWYYTLREAEVKESGHVLGELGSIVVGETIIGLLQVSSESFIHPDNENSNWPFTLNEVTNKKVSMLDVVKYVSN